jgi:hypothetical protein
MLKNAFAAGIVLVAAAGNDNELLDHTNNRWPCAFSTVTCVGATDNNYARWVDPPSGTPPKVIGSNFGSSINMWAPGKCTISGLTCFDSD